MEKKYILTETEMRKIMMYLENTIPNKEELMDGRPGNNFNIVMAIYSDLLEDFENALNMDDSKYVDPETLEIREW